MSNDIKYKIELYGLEHASITKCPYSIKINDRILYVGSFYCKGCEYNLHTDEENLFVKCDHPNKKTIDNVNHPKHYTSHPSGIECIEITRHYNFAIGNAIKYLWRQGLKDGEPSTKDLKKAIWYIEDEIKRIENESTNQRY